LLAAAERLLRVAAVSDSNRKPTFQINLWRWVSWNRQILLAC
jgi:hypothetical protein